MTLQSLSGNYQKAVYTKQNKGEQSMTKEQREAIKSLNEFANTKYGAFTAKEGQTVLSMLKEQQEENKKKDKIIDLIINEFYKRLKNKI